MIDKTISAISTMEGKSKSQIVSELIIREFSNPLLTYPRKSGLVKAMDEEIAKKLGVPLLDHFFENEHIIYTCKRYCDLLGLYSEEDVERIFMNRISLILPRAIQWANQNNPKQIASGLSLTFALFVEIAARSDEVVEQAQKEIFYSVGNFMKSIEEIRKLIEKN